LHSENGWMAEQIDLWAIEHLFLALSRWSPRSRQDGNYRRYCEPNGALDGSLNAVPNQRPSRRTPATARARHTAAGQAATPAAAGAARAPKSSCRRCRSRPRRRIGGGDLRDAIEPLPERCQLDIKGVPPPRHRQSLAQGRPLGPAGVVQSPTGLSRPLKVRQCSIAMKGFRLLPDRRRGTAGANCESCDVRAACAAIHRW
jgi:hypothetical protein